LVLFILLVVVGVPTAYAISITLGGDPVIVEGILDMMNNRITNVGNPTQASDAATKSYVDSAPDSDTLAMLGCTTDQIARWDGSNWVCNTISTYTLNRVTLDSTGLVGEFGKSIAIGSDNFPVISYYDGDPNFDLKLVHCTNTTCSDYRVTTLVSAGLVGQYSSLAIGSDNFPVISYWAITGNDLKLLHCTNTSCSTFDTPVALDFIDRVGSFNSIAIGSDTFPVISYYDDTNDNLKLVHCKNVSCTGGVGVGFDTPVTLDFTTFAGLHTSIAIGFDGFPVISYRDNSVSGLKLVHCKNVSCTGVEGVGFDTPIILDSTGNVGLYNSIAIGSDNFPVISYYDGTNDDLKLVHCKIESCAGGVGVGFDTPVTLDSTDNVGLYTSIAIGSDNFPVISYYISTNANLKLVHCKNVSCTGVEGVGFDTPITLASRDNVGKHTSIAIGFDDIHFISYYDATNEDLKLAACTIQGKCGGTVIIFE